MNSWDGMDEIVAEFIVESREHLDRLDVELIDIERFGPTQERIAAVFRSAHTIKGTAGFLGFGRVEALAHAGEDLLAAVRDGRIEVTAEHIGALLEMVDLLRAQLQHVESDGGDEHLDVSNLVSRLRVLVSDTTAAPTPTGEPRTGTIATAASTSTLRIDVEVLDRLMNLVGELVLTRNQLLRLSDNSGRELHHISQHLNLITAQLQQGVTQARMQPVGNAWAKLPRLVRDVARACGKQVDLTTEGADTELDKTLLEAIADPLIHLVRNAVDHGIEPPEQRGTKPPAGRIHLRAWHEAGVVSISLSDDGRGIDLDQVLAKAVQQGLVDASTGVKMSDSDIADLIFHPGLSTAREVTAVSGRGVGMDVVRSAINNVGGVVSVATTPGEGTVFHIQIPLTLAIIPALLVAQNGSTYAIPHVNLVELVRNDRPFQGIPTARVLNLRGQLIPVLDLDELFNGVRSRPAGSGVVIVAAAGNQRFALVVDDVEDTAEIVVKPLPQQLGNDVVFSGATVTGDGNVVLILDAMALANHVAARDDTTSDAHQISGADPVGETAPTVVVRAGERLLAIPATDIVRLEQIDIGAVSQGTDGPGVVYQGTILPLTFLTQSTATRNGPAAHVVVVDQPMHGYVVDEVVDLAPLPRNATGDVVWGDRIVSVTDLTALKGAAR